MAGKLGLNRLEALVEQLDRDLNLASTTLTNVGASTFASTLGVTGILTATAGVLNSNLTVSSATGTAVDLTSTASDLKVIMTGTWSGTIQLPQATANNVGMLIEIMLAADADTDGTAIIAVSNAGSTVMTGVVHLVSTDAKMDVIPIHATTNNTKAIHFDADAANHAGGKEGTIARFYYQAANKIFAEVRGITSAGTPALDANAVVATGFS